MILTLISIDHILKGLVPGATSLWFIKVQLCSYGGNNVLSLYFRNVMCCQEACHPLAQAGLQNFWGQVGFIGNTFKITMFSKIVLQFLYHQKSLIHRQEIVQWFVLVSCQVVKCLTPGASYHQVMNHLSLSSIWKIWSRKNFIQGCASAGST